MTFDLGDVSYDIVANNLTSHGLGSAVSDFKSAEGEINQSLDKIDKKADSTTMTLGKLTAGFAAIAGASMFVQGVTDKWDALNQTSELGAYNLKISSDEFVRLAQSVSDAEHPTAEMVQTMILLSRAGEDMSTIKQVAIDFRDLGEALQMDSATVANSVVPALKAFNLDVSDAGEYTYIFANVVAKSMIDLGEFTTYVQRLAPYMNTLGLGIEDVAAMFEILSDRGIQGRQAMSIATQVADLMAKGNKDLEGATKTLTEATKDYDSALKSLNEEKKKTNDITGDYLYKMQNVGRDVGAARRLTQEYNLEMRHQSQKVAEAQALVETTGATKMAAQSAVDTAKAAPKMGFAEATRMVAESTGKNVGMTDKELKDKVAGMDKEIVSKLTTSMEEHTQSSKTNAKAMDDLTLQLGETLQPLQEISGALTMITGPITALAGLSTILSNFGLLGGAGGGLAGGGGGIAGGLGGAGGVAGLGAMGLAAGAAGGLALGGGVVLGMERAGLLGLTGEGAVRTAGSQFMGHLTGENQRRYLADYLRTHNGQYPPEMTEGMAEYASGGYVPKDQVAKLHAGETVIPAGARSLSISIGNVNLSKDYPFEKMMDDMSRYQDEARRKSGVPT